MEDGSYRAQRSTGRRRRAAEEPEDVLARHGLVGSDPPSPPSGGRAARRRAAEARGAADDPISGSGRHFGDPVAAPWNGAGRHGVPVDEEPPRRGRRRLPDDHGPARPPGPPRRLNGHGGTEPATYGPDDRGTGYGRTANGHGAEARVSGRDLIGLAVDGHDVDRRPANGHGVNGHAPHGHAPNGRSRDERDWNERGARGRRADAQDAHGHSTNGHSANGHSANGHSANGHDLDGRARRHRPPEEPAPPAAPRTGRRRLPDPPDRTAPAPPHAQVPDAAAAVRPGTRPPSGGGRRRRPDLPEPAPATAAPVPGGRRHRDEAPATSATTALPAAAPRRGRGEPDPAAGIAPHDRPRRSPNGRPDTADATTALPAPGRAPRRAAPAPPATAPPGPGARRRAAPDPAPPTPPPPTRAPADPATTALPAGRRAAPRAASNPEATAVVAPVGSPVAARQNGLREKGIGESGVGEAADELERSRRSEPEPVDARTRALRIDETLTRLTAAHAGLTLAVTDREQPPPPVRRSAASTAGRLLAAALAVAVVVTTAFGWGTKSWLGSSVGDAAALDPGSGAIVEPATQVGDENVLVVGTEPNPEGAAVRADTVAVAHIPEGGGPVTVLAFPHDLEINRPPCERWDPISGGYTDETVPAEARTQLVSALDVGGPRCLTRVVQQLSGIAVTKYVGTDLSAVPAMTEAVGGAQVCVPRPVLDGVLGPVVPDPGMQALSGVRAADFVQAGEVEGDPSPEYGRIERQQRVLAAVLDQAVSGTALLDVGQIMALRPALADAVLVDGAGLDQVLALATTLRDLDAEGVRFASVPTSDRNNRGNLVLRDTAAADLFAAVRSDAALPAEATDPEAGDTGPAPSEVTVEVVNASDRSGLAGEVGETLRSLGFDVGEVSSAEQPTSETVIRFSPDQAAAAELLATTVPSAESVPDPGATGVLHLVLGRSFDDVVRAPSAPIALSAPTTAAPEGPEAACA
ncbi:LCP family glycopolymer transferase [Pseudonocardia sichuanensis]